MRRLLLGLVFLVVLGPLDAARIGELVETSLAEQALRFWTLQDPSVRIVLLGTVCMGICCGLMGAFIVVRKMALLGDTLSHAVLPGIAAGFLWNQTKDLTAMFTGAIIAGFLGILMVNAIRKTTHLKEDAALGMVLSGFYAVGICMLTMIQRLPTAEKTGLNDFLFGQAAALGEVDVATIVVVTVLSLVFVFLSYKELLVSSFDSGFAGSIGLPIRWVEYALYVLLTFGIVVSLKAAGVLLVSALLIIPPACAYLLTDNFVRMLVISCAVGVVSAVLGGFFSFLKNDLPTGPFMVVVAAVIFICSFLLSPKYGWLPRVARRRRRSGRIRDENLLRSIYQVREKTEFHSPDVTLGELSKHRNEDLIDVARRARALISARLAFYNPAQTAQQGALLADRRLVLTAEGALRACQIVRNHRLWELYLTHAADYQSDHVHDDADRIEHILGEDTVRALERRLNHPRRDPHGKLIPSMSDMDSLYRSQEVMQGSTYRGDF